MVAEGAWVRFERMCEKAVFIFGNAGGEVGGVLIGVDDFGFFTDPTFLRKVGLVCGVSVATVTLSVFHELHYRTYRLFYQARWRARRREGLVRMYRLEDSGKGT